jgi:hypothetical protein
MSQLQINAMITAVKNIIADTTLTPEEKTEKIKAIQLNAVQAGYGTAEGVTPPVVPPAATGQRITRRSKVRIGKPTYKTPKLRIRSFYKKRPKYIVKKRKPIYKIPVKKEVRNSDRAGISGLPAYTLPG